VPDPMDAYLWLTFLEGSHLSDSTRLWIDQINTAFNTKQTSDWIITLIERVTRIRETCSDPCEKAEVTVECALAYDRLSEFARAIQLLKEAEALYQRHPHYHAVVLWMEGCILWQLPGSHDQASILWKQSEDAFYKLRRWSTDPAHVEWYTRRVQQIREAIVNQVGSESSQTSSKNQDPSEILLQLFRVVEKVPAGGFASVGYDSVTLGAVEVKQVLIEGRLHRVANLRGTDKLVRLLANHYVVVKITGDSMNHPSGKTSVPINDGDYVLLVEQEDARSGDIVAAEIDGVDSCATLKRFSVLKPGARYLLEPESTNSNHQIFEFTRLNQGFHIRGVALAVFKPL
jgi:phage repressor protein C with HTH and peptisase S24 domain